MPQMHFYVSKPVAAALRQNAKSKGLTVSKYLASIVQRAIHPGWPKGYFEEVIGGWSGQPLERLPQGDIEERQAL